MSPFEKISKEIDQITSLHKKSRLARFLCRVEYLLRKYLDNRPINFLWVDVEGEPVGEPFEVIHLMLPDMMEHQACGILTGKVLLDGLRANALKVLVFERLDQMSAKTILQPRWVPPEDVVSIAA